MAEDPHRPLTIAHQGVAACLVQLCATPFLDDAAADAAAMLAEMLPHAHGDHPVAEALVLAAREVEACWPQRHVPGGGVAWTRALSAARLAVCSYYRGRAAACHARIFPETQPSPEAIANA
jgi:hypothetical protein